MPPSPRLASPRRRRSSCRPTPAPMSGSRCGDRAATCSAVASNLGQPEAPVAWRWSAVLRRILLAASASDRVRQAVTTAPYTRDVVTRFVAGDTADEAIGVTRRLLADGLLVSLDYLGEDTADREQG